MEINEEEADDIMNQIDADGGGELEPDQFIEFLKREDERIEYSNEECQKIFNYFVSEENADSIGFEQLKYMFQCLGETVTDGEVLKMIVFADKNCDGRLDFQ